MVSNKEFSDAVALYQRRWEIETLFGCLKTRGFRMEDTHMTAPEKIEKLLFEGIAKLALRSKSDDFSAGLDCRGTPKAQ